MRFIPLQGGAGNKANKNFKEKLAGKRRKEKIQIMQTGRMEVDPAEGQAEGCSLSDELLLHIFSFVARDLKTRAALKMVSTTITF